MLTYSLQVGPTEARWIEILSDPNATAEEIVQVTVDKSYSLEQIAIVYMMLTDGRVSILRLWARMIIVAGLLILALVVASRSNTELPHGI